MHAAIRAGQTNCVAVVQHYIERARAYNGVASVLVTEDGAAIPEADGRGARAGAAALPDRDRQGLDASCPTSTSTAGTPLEFGRMEATASDPSVQQQYGMIVGMPDAGQLNALATLNIRGERSVTCRGEFDRHPVAGTACRPARRRCARCSANCPTRSNAPPSSTRATGSNPDLDEMPMYGVVFSFKDPFDTKDMRTTARRRRAPTTSISRRATTCWSSSCATRARSSSPRRSTPNTTDAPAIPAAGTSPDKVLPSVLGYQRSSWGGNPANPYDTTRAASLGSSSGSGVSVSANLVMASLGEETRASCRGPANHNAVALILPHKAMLGFDGGAIGADIYCDRSGILARTIADCAKVLDALKDPVAGYYDPRDPYTTVPRSSVLPTPYASHATSRRQSGRAQRHAHRHRPRVDAGTARRKGAGADRHRRRGRDQGDARRQARRDAGRIDRSAVGARPRHRADEARFPHGARAAGAGVHARPPVPPRARTAQPLFKEFAAAIRPTEFLPGKVFGTGTMTPIDYCVELAEGRIAPPANLDIATIQEQELAMSFRFHIPQYLSRRAADWQARGFTETLDRFRRAQSRAPNSGATTAAPRSGTGRRSPTRATRSAAVRASTSASCCASCCAGST